MKRRNFNLISALIHEQWAIDPFYALLHLEVVEKLIAGEPVAWVDREEDREEDPDVVEQVSQLWIQDGGQWRRSSDSENISDAVQMISVQGPIVKFGTCGDAGTVDYVEALNRAYANKKVGATLVAWDSPGGQLNGTPSLHDAIKNDAKPTVSVVDDGMMASAALWGAVSSDLILASQKTDLIGSIGVYSTLRDYRDYYKQRGITSLDVYSRKSTKKNIEYRKALEGDLSALQDRLDKSADQFIETVQQARGKKLTSKDWQEGGIYTADEALTMGLVDGFGSIQEALSIAADMAKTRTKKSFSPTNKNKTQKSNMSLVNKAKAFLMGADATGATDPAAARDAALEALAQVAEERQTQIATLQTELATSNQNLTTARTRITELEGQVSTLTTERDQYQQQAAEYGSQPGATPTPKATNKKVEGQGEEVKTATEKTAGNSLNQFAAEFGL
jgi:protease IV